MANAIDWFGGDTTVEQSERFAALYDLDAPHGADPAIDWFRAIARRTGGTKVAATMPVNRAIENWSSSGSSTA